MLWSKDEAKEAKTLSSVSNADSANTFLKQADLAIGDKVIFSVKRNGYNSAVTDVEVEIKQYIYTAK